MITSLKNIVETKGWIFKHGRKDYLIHDSGTLKNLTEGQIFVGLDPVQRTPNTSAHGIENEVKYTGTFMIVTRATIDETYTTKQADHIEPMEARIKAIEKEIACQEYLIRRFKATDGVNLTEQNLDGYIVEFEIDYVIPSYSVDKITSLTVTNNPQTPGNGNAITEMVVTTNYPAVISLAGDTTGLTITENTETQATISGTKEAATKAVVVAAGKYGGILSELLDLGFEGATVENSDQSYQESIAAGGTEILPDIDINIKDGITPLGTVTREAATDQDVDISAYRPDSVTENSDQSYSESVSIGSTHVLPDIDITINDGATQITVVTREAAIDQAVDISSLILRSVLWMNQVTYDALASTDADTHYIIDDDLADGVTETIYDA